MASGSLTRRAKTVAAVLAAATAILVIASKQPRNSLVSHDVLRSLPTSEESFITPLRNSSVQDRLMPQAVAENLRHRIARRPTLGQSFETAAQSVKQAHNHRAESLDHNHTALRKHRYRTSNGSGHRSHRPHRLAKLEFMAPPKTPADTPWLFAGAEGGTKRARSQLQMRKNSGYFGRDSPPVPLRAPNGSLASGPVLTGTAWHWGPGRCPEACSARGVCSPEHGRCDCAPYAWGADCSVSVVTQRICVMNDSRPWFCDKPACIASRDEAYTLDGHSAQCVGEPLDACPRRCDGRGACVCNRGSCRCECYEGFTGKSCSEATAETACLNDCFGRGVCERGFCHCHPPFWGTDCARGGEQTLGVTPHGAASAAPAGVASATAASARNGSARATAAAANAPVGEPRCTRRPCVYVYDLPARMNVLALKAEYDWRVQRKGKKFDYRMPQLFHSALLGSTHRTADAADADYFYVPVWDFQGAWGNPEVYYRAAVYIASAYPFWNASSGADHIWTVARDAAACATPWGSLLDELQNSTILSAWGGVTGLSGRPEERCFAPDRDIAVPGALTHAAVSKSPFLLAPRDLEAQMRSRTTQLFFIGALCWKLDVKVKTMQQLEKKCKESYGAPGFLSRYSFGLRYEIFKLHGSASGFRLYATDYPPSLPRHRVAVNEEILRARFCLCPSGTGWGMRVFHVLALGCVPVLVQHDGVHPPVAQAFEPHLDWDAFAVSVRRDDVRRLPQILEQVDLAAKQAALAKVWTRMVWRTALSEPLRSRLAAPDAFQATMEALELRLRSRSSRQLRETGVERLDRHLKPAV
uniref:EGF-like domain-containing protein n=1 Tax=Chrysotila carterae TaxID=13221 RepID=A0A7S4B4E5_CHRCT